MGVKFNGRQKIRTMRPELTDPTPVDPTFVVNDLIDKFCDFEDFSEFNNYVCNTFLSRGHLLTKQWSAFLARSTTPKTLATWLDLSFDRLSEIPFLRIDDPVLRFITEPLKHALRRPVSPRRLERFFEVSPSEKPRRGPNQVVQPLISFALAEIVYTAHLGELRASFDFLKLPCDDSGNVQLSEYELMRHLYKKYDHLSHVMADVSSALKISPQSVESFCLKKFFFHNNVVLRSEYKKILVDVGSTGAFAASSLSIASEGK
jgi:hypothetical protein